MDKNKSRRKKPVAAKTPTTTMTQTPVVIMFSLTIDAIAAL